MIQFVKKINIFLFLFPFLIIGQAENLDFVNYKENVIHFYNKNSNLDSFYKKLDRLLEQKEGKVKILQIGGSHIQAEIWPDQMRQNFLDLKPEINGGRGFVFPFKLAKTWNPKNFQIKYTGNWKSFRNSIKKHNEKWGVSGITVVTMDSISTFQIGYKNDTLTNYVFNRIKIFHDIGNTSFEIKLLSQKPIKTIVNKKIGYTEFILDKELDTLSVQIRKINKNRSQFRLYGLSLENNCPGIVYTSIGVNGAKTSSYLRNELFENQLKTIKPDLVIFCIGINDAYNPNFCATCFEDNYEKLIKIFQQVNPKTNFLFVTNNDSYVKQKYVNKRVFQARDVMISLATKYNAGLWDLFEVMGGLNSITGWEKNGFAKKDKIHFTDKGYKLLGNLMFQALMKDYENYKEKNATN